MILDRRRKEVLESRSSTSKYYTVDESIVTLHGEQTGVLSGTHKDVKVNRYLSDSNSTSLPYQMYELSFVSTHTASKGQIATIVIGQRPGDRSLNPQKQIQESEAGP